MLYVDIYDLLIAEKVEINNKKAVEDLVYNVPFNLYVEGSYFGDSDCLIPKKR